MPLPERFQNQGRLDGWLGYRVWPDAERVGKGRNDVLRSRDRPLQHGRRSDRHTKERIHFDRRTSLPLRWIAKRRGAVEKHHVRARSDETECAIDCSLSSLAIRAFTPVCDGL